VDCLVPDGDRVLVLEFKTGRAQPAHRRQLALYVDAVRDMLAGTQVTGQLVYAARPEPARPMAAGMLPFDD
jgi:RecB family endonuclease NucS